MTYSQVFVRFYIYIFCLVTENSMELYQGRLPLMIAFSPVEARSTSPSSSLSQITAFHTKSALNPVVHLILED